MFSEDINVSKRWWVNVLNHLGQTWSQGHNIWSKLFFRIYSPVLVFPLRKPDWHCLGYWLVIYMVPGQRLKQRCPLLGVQECLQDIVGMYIKACDPKWDNDFWCVEQTVLSLFFVLLVIIKLTLIGSDVGLALILHQANVWSIHDIFVRVHVLGDSGLLCQIKWTKLGHLVMWNNLFCELAYLDLSWCLE